MVFNQRPDELIADVIQRGLTTFKTTIEGVTEVIRAGDSTLQELDNALTGSRPRYGETAQESFMAILQMLSGTLEDAREKKSATAMSVTQKSREILARINAVEPAWRPGPLTRTAPDDIFRAAMRDLRSSNSLIRLAQGAGTIEDLEEISRWAGDLNQRIEHMKVSAAEPKSPAPGPRAAAADKKTVGKKPKKDTTPKAKPQSADVAFALAVAAEMDDDKVKGWAKEFASGKISEDQWVTRLTTHAAKDKDSLDDIFARAEQRVAKENHGESDTSEDQS